MRHEGVNDEALAGYCGLYCGFCAKFQSVAPSRCPGCHSEEVGSYCSIWRCATRKKGVESCSDCEEFPDCEVFTRRKVMEWPTAGENLETIVRDGLRVWTEAQKRRRLVLEGLLDDYNEGRSMAFYCRAVSRMPIGLIEEAVRDVEERIASGDVDREDVKQKAKAMKAGLTETATTRGISLDK
ncbi:MAG: DUF3795 domain-containing protein [Actinobacteria bacterium]|nr:DUF3795 domain-containing protein [Actinomycetota bacterium]MBU2687889.1 DUF3795 domain-containing protein [Actinomycetota bacterium]